MREPEEAEGSWDLDIPKTDYLLEPMSPKELQKVVALLKQQQVATLKIKFGFSNEYFQNIFNQLMKEELNDEDFREQGKKREIGDLYRRKEMGRENGVIFEIGSRIRSEVFVRAYRGNKLDKLERDYNIKVQYIGRDIYIESECKVKKGSVVHSQLFNMYKRLKIYVFYHHEELWQVVKNSEEFKRRLEKIGIQSFVGKWRRKDVAFYSFDYEPEEIRKEVLKQNSFKPRVLKLEDNELSIKDNMRIFDVVVKSVRPTIDLIRNTYEANLEVNKNNSCFVLHLKHEVFAEEPVAQISRVVSNLFIMSFPLRNSRSFINELKRNSKKYSFINATHYNKTIFCCIDRTMVQNKHDILSVFAPFLEGLDQYSRLTIHLKPNCVLQQNSTLPSQILDLTEECKLEVENYQQVLESTKFNIIVKPRLFNSETKKAQKQMEISKFLLKLLMIEEKQRQITEEELNKKILNPNCSMMEENTDDSGTNARNKRGNRGRDKGEAKKETKVERKERPRREEKLEVQGKNKQEQKPAENKSVGCQLNTQYKRPEGLDTGELFKKLKKDGQIEELIESREGIKVKCWRLKVNLEAFSWTLQNETLLMKEKGYFVAKIDGRQDFKTLELVQFGKMKDEQMGYLVYRAEGSEFWMPTHMIQKF